jgi:two-component system cell cycle sensor histidine kinase/response regulator CckA
MCYCQGTAQQTECSFPPQNGENRLVSDGIMNVDELEESNARLNRELAEIRKELDELKAREERFRILFENAPDGMYLSDLRGTFMEGNREAERIIGYPRNELIGKSYLLLNLLPPSQLIKAAGLLTKSILGIPTGPDEITIKRKNGTSILVEISTFPITVGGQKAVLGIARDISKRKKAGEEALQLKIELHHAEKMEAVSRLAGGIAHDFNNLLGGIVGYADLLRMKLSSTLPSESATAQKIVDIAQQVSRLTAQLLAFSRKGKYQVQAIDLHECLDETAQILERTINRKINVVKKLEASSSVVMGDRSQLQNAFMNLGINARDAMPDGGTLTFESSLFELDEAVARSYPYQVNPGTFIKTSVTDTGIGMDAETRGRAFEPFFSTKPSGKGTGLGLASVYGTVKNHGGFIELWSEKGKGTAVIICLPITTALPITREIGDATGKERKISGRILIVDDEKIIRDMAADALSMLGYTVASCANGHEAVSKFREQSGAFDLVFLDLTMPGMGGRECLRELRSINPRIKVIISSGHALDDEISTLLKEDSVAFLQKPFNVRLLSDAVRTALGA